MERLSGLDASFLYLETPNLHMHVSMASVFDPATAPGGYSFARLRDRVSARIEGPSVFRRRLVEVPLRLGHPYWVEDVDFDIDYHLRRAALPSPGGMAELAALVGDVCGRQLDRAKPLWQMYLVEGLQDGRVAVITKIHHATIDGASGAELLGHLFELEPDPPEYATVHGDASDATSGGASPSHHGPGGSGPNDHGHGGSGPNDRPPRRRGLGVPPDYVVLGRAVIDRASRPLEVSRIGWHTGRAVVDMMRARRAAPSPQARGALPLTAPRTSLNTAITPHRAVALVSTSLDDVKAVKRVIGCTVNDVVLAMCTGALRQYLLERDELPAGPLVATVPVAVEPSLARQMRGSNKVSAMWVALPCHLADPLARVEHIRAGTRGAKEQHRALGIDVLVDWTEHASPNLFSLAVRAYTRFRLAEHHRPLYSLVVSNVPGPDFPLYLAGAEMVAGFPLGPITDGAGLNITVMSYRGVLNWGLMACPETVPGVWDIARALGTALDELMAVTGVGSSTPAGISPPVPAGAPAGPAATPRARARRASPATAGAPEATGTRQTNGTSTTRQTNGTRQAIGTRQTSGTSATRQTNGTSQTNGTRQTTGTSGTSGTRQMNGTSATRQTSGTRQTNGTLSAGTRQTTGTSATRRTGGTRRSGSSGAPAGAGPQEPQTAVPPHGSLP